MNLTMVNVFSGDAELLAQVRELYESAFPEEERRGWNELCLKLADVESGFSITAILNDETEMFAGFISRWEMKEFVYVEHFAIAERYRGCGCGGKVIDYVVKNAGKPVVLEAEMPDSGEMAQRRIEFYRRHGFRAGTECKYIQPSYETGLPLMPLMLMVNGDIDLNVAARSIRKIVYKADW